MRYGAVHMRRAVRDASQAHRDRLGLLVRAADARADPLVAVVPPALERLGRRLGRLVVRSHRLEHLVPAAEDMGRVGGRRMGVRRSVARAAAAAAHRSSSSSSPSSWIARKSAGSPSLGSSGSHLRTVACAIVRRSPSGSIARRLPSSSWPSSRQPSASSKADIASCTWRGGREARGGVRREQWEPCGAAGPRSSGASLVHLVLLQVLLVAVVVHRPKQRRVARRRVGGQPLLDRADGEGDRVVAGGAAKRAADALAEERVASASTPPPPRTPPCRRAPRPPRGPRSRRRRAPRGRARARPPPHPRAATCARWR